MIGVVNIKSFTVNNNDAGKRLDKFVLKATPKLPTALMYKYVRLKRIKLNGGSQFTQDEMCSICNFLDIKYGEIPSYFFAVLV